MATVDTFNVFLSDYANVSRYLNTRLNKLLTTQHLTADTFLIMHEIGQSSQPLLLMDIAHRHRVSRSAISRQISVLLSHQYICQQANTNDRRQKGLSLTDAGRRLDQQLITTIHQTVHQWTLQLGQPRVDTLLSILNDFNDQIISHEVPTSN
ncbi:MarR family transcriptional regulator [Lactiplantibacillus paraplantarum]|uniref:MarR family winged helix-turn-helix transcriptional regulator n=1 Tax=Lactiplantibacillus paraplantarum TaxID=60520 RepID=UPI00051467E1|nr:MarR family transcriptional regulator [Lactiplantibacillus paraplantarum]OAX76333.1 transcriptional regulator [Lactiplantibacillus plantarum]KGE76692.1 transcriptional regulator [Lactiplantibacillus paraplantarum]MCT4458034.1 MarR family transcriptional regulator [Lactiplantibacillus paraplantarum]MCW1911111.1 MarR family transcriptional regulator [Lactiplantibacillus paraplantarum]RDG09120.1 MarR family transcriptional regulator [Lactiplantibacillus paraplantarum]